MKIESKDITFNYDRYGYMLFYKGLPIGGAGAKGKPKMHWQHARQNVADNHNYAESAKQGLLNGNGHPHMIDNIKKIKGVRA